jgi:hypothetical protein
MRNMFLIVGFALLIIALVVGGPLATIWAVNELGQYLWPQRVVPYTFWTWVAVLVIGAFLKGSVTYKK